MTKPSTVKTLLAAAGIAPSEQDLAGLERDWATLRQLVAALYAVEVSPDVESGRTVRQPARSDAR